MPGLSPSSAPDTDDVKSLRRFPLDWANSWTSGAGGFLNAELLVYDFPPYHKFIKKSVPATTNTPPPNNEPFLFSLSFVTKEGYGPWDLARDCMGWNSIYHYLRPRDAGPVSTDPEHLRRNPGDNDLWYDRTYFPHRDIKRDVLIQ